MNRFALGALLGCFSLLIGSSAYLPKVIYVSFSRPLTASAARSGLAARLPVMSSVDDVPLERITLPFPFPFFGEDVYRIYGSSNGYLLLENDPPCGSSFLIMPFCTLDSYKGVIGPLVNDFDSTVTATSKVYFFTSSNEVYFEYQNFTEFQQPPETSRVFDFGCSLFGDGSIVFKYAAVPSMSGREWFAGIRPQVPYEDKFKITSSQMSVGASNWLTNVVGVYPNKVDVTNGKETVFCPISTTWCVSPSVIYRSSPPESFVFTPLSTSCAQDIQFGYYIENNPVYISSCVLNQTQGEFRYECFVNHTTIASINNPRFQMKLVWRRLSVSSHFAALEIDPFLVYVKNGTAGANPYSNAADTNCTVNSGACSDETCSLCASDLVCLGLPCLTADYSGLMLVPDLYANYSCRGTCNSSFEVDREGNCCLSDLIDCNGLCNGTTTAGLSEDSDVYKCCERETLDCFGRCSGDGFLDTCGVCRLPGEAGPTCETYFEIDTGFEDGIMYEFYDYVSNGTKTISSYNLTFKNTNETTLSLKMSLHKSVSTAAPVMYLPFKELSIPGLTSYNLSIGSSITDLFTGNKTVWQAKTIRLYLTRPSLFSYTVNIDLKLYPDTRNCSMVTDSDVCISLPGCMNCFNTPGYRVLFVPEDQCPLIESNNSETNGTTAACSRELFANVIPSATNADRGELKHKPSICQNSWRSTDCKTHSFSYDYEQHDQTSAVHIVIGVCIFSSIFIIVFYMFRY